MSPIEDYLDINRRLWDDKVAHHFGSDFYGVRDFLAGKNMLHGIELDLLPDIRGKKVLHLQCHFGLDTLSLARMGATVTGIDLSSVAIAKAEELNRMAGLDGRFVCSDVYRLPENLEGDFDLVFTSYGTIGWLPDVDRWAEVIRHFLRPGGHFVFAEFHPALWMFDNDFTRIEYAYFNRGTIVEEETGTYADRSAPIAGRSVTWNHDIAEVLTALLNKNMRLEVFREFDYSPHDCFNRSVKVGEDRYQIEGMEGKLPMVYGLRMAMS